MLRFNAPRDLEAVWMMMMKSEFIYREQTSVRQGAVLLSSYVNEQTNYNTKIVASNGGGCSEGV